MQISTTARHCELDTETRQFAEQRMGKFEKYARDILEAHLIVTAEKYRHTAEITLKLKNKDMISSEESTEPRVAIDMAADRIEKQLRRFKERRLDRRRHGNGTDPLAGAPEESFDFDDDEGAVREE